MVYSAALRQLHGDTHRAEDLTQQVFSEMARQARPLSRHPALAGWLYTTTRQMAWRALRSEQRRAAREHEAHAMNELLRPAAEPDWDHLRPALDGAMHELNNADRLALLLRYFKNKSLREVGLELGLTENAARMRVERALDKLRLALARHGVTSTAAAAALAMSAHAVNAAPAGFAAALAQASLAGAASKTGTALGLLKFMASTKLKFGLSALVIAGAAVVLVLEHQARLKAQDENDILRLQLAQMKTDNEALSNRLDRAARERAARLAASASNAGASAGTPPGVFSTNSFRQRLMDNPIKVTAGQLESYLKRRHRDAGSLLASFRVTHDPALLAEAMQKYPSDPHVDFEALFQSNAPPEEQRRWLTAFEQSAPNNALANYLSAGAYFKAGDPAQALQEMLAASDKPGFQDYSIERVMDDREAYIESGCTDAEAEISSCTQLMLPQLLQIRNLGLDLVDLSKSYQQAGDSDSAQSALQMAAALGQRYATQAPAEAEISQLVGLFVERRAFAAMDPSLPCGDNGQTVQDQLNQVAQERADLNSLDQQAQPFIDSMSDQDYLTYKSRWMAFGEKAALQWVIGKYGQQP